MHISATLAVVTLLALSCARSTLSLQAPFDDPHTVSNRTGIVHLFEWKWDDIAKECEDFLAPKGYAGVQISPPTENLIIWSDGDRPWYERYQPISYRLVTRSGDERQLADMIRRCNDVGVRVYADLVINHMTANADNAVGTGGTKAKPNEMSYPDVPYTADHFHKPACQIGKNYDDCKVVRNCELNGLHDLDHGQPYVRGKIIELMNHLIDLGVAGFRIDAVKHMWPADLLKIVEGMKPLNTNFGFPPNSKPFIYQEVIDLGYDKGISYKEYLDIGRIIDFRYGAAVSKVFRGETQLQYLKTFGPDWAIVDSPKAVVFIDNHDNQRDDDGHGPILNYKTPRLYKMAIAFMLANPIGVPRVLSSYFFDKKDKGPPMKFNGDLISPKFENGVCSNGYVCEHRWKQIANMIGFRLAAGDTKIENWWSNGNNQIAFSRGNRAFIAFNNENNALDTKLQTGLPAGKYCDVISGGVDKSGSFCTGKTITVGNDGKAQITINPKDEDGVVAIHVNARTK